MITQKACLLFKKLDQLNGLNIDFVFLLIFLIDIYSSYIYLYLILIAETASNYPELKELLLEHKVPGTKCSCAYITGNNE